MSLDLDTRQRAMLKEMGITVWQPETLAEAADDIQYVVEKPQNTINNIAAQAINTTDNADLEANFMDFCVSKALAAFPDAFKVYTSGLESWIFNNKASAAIGQPLLGDGVLTASCRKRVQNPLTIKPELEPDTSHSSAAVMRAGSQDRTSSARAAHLPAHSQFRPFPLTIRTPL